jgi:hypothetical protein
MNQIISFEKIRSEENLHSFLIQKGFSTNYSKSINENGHDIIAVKNGVGFLIEFKKLELRENGAYRYGGDILGDVAICVTESGFPIFLINEKTSLTKTSRLIDMLFGT